MISGVRFTHLSLFASFRVSWLRNRSILSDFSVSSSNEIRYKTWAKGYSEVTPIDAFLSSFCTRSRHPTTSALSIGPQYARYTASITVFPTDMFFWTSRDAV